MDERAQFLLRRRICGDTHQRRIFFQSLAVRIAQHFEIKRFLIAKMVVDCGDVCARAPTNLTHRRIAETDFRKNRARRVQQMVARFIRAGFGEFSGHI